MKTFDEIANNEFLDADILTIEDTKDIVTQIDEEMYNLKYDVNDLKDILKSNNLKFKKCRLRFKAFVNDDDECLFKYNNEKKQISMYISTNVEDEGHFATKMIINFELNEDNNEIAKMDFNELRLYNLDTEEELTKDETIFFEQLCNDLAREFILVLHTLNYTMNYKLKEPITERKCICENNKIVRLICCNNYIIDGTEEKIENKCNKKYLQL